MGPQFEASFKVGPVRSGLLCSALGVVLRLMPCSELRTRGAFVNPEYGKQTQQKG